jgi:hypothetical protein
MDLYSYGLRVGVSAIIYVILVMLMSFMISQLKKRSNRLLNPSEYFPEEEVKTLKQVYYLILIFLIILSITNFFFDNDIFLSNNPEFYALNSILDIIISVYIATVFYQENWKKNIILIIFLFPLASISYLIFGGSYIEIWDFLRIPAFIYIIKRLYDKFKSYTDEHNLGLSIILLFSIIFLSVVSTIFLENKAPLDAIVMVSNAFTSNGYAILGDSPGGKINSVILVWSGYIISGAATATLTATIILRHIQHQLDEYKEKVEELQSTIGELKEMVNEKD